VQFRPPAGVFTAEHQGTDPTVDSDADANGFTDVFTLYGSSLMDHLDAGLVGFGHPSGGGE
jgi:hypothetical protein